MRRSPLKRIREKPRRNEGRVKHKRTKGKAKVEPTAIERKHMDRVAALGCCVCGAPATIHHVTSDGYKRIARSHQRVAPLCPTHHQIQWGPRESVEAMGHAGFAQAYGIDLAALAVRLWEESEAIFVG